MNRFVDHLNELQNDPYFEEFITRWNRGVIKVVLFGLTLVMLGVAGGNLIQGDFTVAFGWAFVWLCAMLGPLYEWIKFKRLPWDG